MENIVRDDIPLGETFDELGRALTLKLDCGRWSEKTYRDDGELATYKDSYGFDGINIGTKECPVLYDAARDWYASGCICVRGRQKALEFWKSDKGIKPIIRGIIEAHGLK